MTLAANAGTKMDIARQVDAADVYVDLPRDKDQANAAWDQLLKENPNGALRLCQGCAVKQNKTDHQMSLQALMLLLKRLVLLHLRRKPSIIAPKVEHLCAMVSILKKLGAFL